MIRRKILCYFESSYLEDTFQEICEDLQIPVMFKKQWDQLHPLLLTKQVDTLVIETPEPNESLINYLRLCLNKKLVKNIIFLTYHDVQRKWIQKGLLLNLPSHWFNVTLPELTDNLRTLIIKTSGALPVAGQKFPRYETNQHIEIHSLSSTQSMSSKMLNISYGGMQCTCLSEFNFKMGEYVRLNVKLNELNRSHILNAKVVWVEDNHRGSKKMGLAFVSNQDMYQQMLNFI